MNTVDHAKQEFEILGWPGNDKMQQMACDNVLELLEVFDKQGHSGSSAPYILGIFKELASLNPIAPLTGEDSEWNDISEMPGKSLFQNKRDSPVFKDSNGEAYWIEGKIFRDKDGCLFTNNNSQVTITFPWTKPKPEIIDIDT